MGISDIPRILSRAEWSVHCKIRFYSVMLESKQNIMLHYDCNIIELFRIMGTIESPPLTHPIKQVVPETMLKSSQTCLQSQERRECI